MNEYALVLQTVKGSSCNDCIFSTPDDNDDTELCPKVNIKVAVPGTYTLACAIPKDGIYQESVFTLVHKVTGQICTPEEVVSHYERV